ncbi:unnamed protein product [Taenia asiatica]|uniref:RRM domain-containing protein n=1 Tax=Taenia asiatica TaxID=60517 RepID=A0A0R3VUA9_TAEAS|nr:unnamed protein product [Taenia asiatica]
MSDPYGLPCKRTFGSLPCLLSHAGAETAHYVHCHSTLDVAELLSKHTSVKQLTQEQNREQNQEEQREDCAKQHVLKQQCNLMLHAKLNDLSHQRALLKVRLEELLVLKSSTLKMEKKTKAEIIKVLKRAVFQLRSAAGAALNAAISKVEKADETSCKSLHALVQQFTGLLVGVSRTQDALTLMRKNTNLKEALEDQKWLEWLRREVTLLEDTIMNLRTTPITQMQVSDEFTKVQQDLSNFDLLTCDGPVLPPHILSSCNIGDEGKEINRNDAESGHQMGVRGLRTRPNAKRLSRNFGQYDKDTNVGVEGNNHTAIKAFPTTNAAQIAVAAPPPHLRSAKLCGNLLGSHDCRKGVALDAIRNGHQIVVEGLPLLARRNDVGRHFYRFGTVTDVSIDEKMHRAIVTFSTAIAAQLAVATPPPQLKGAKLRIYLPKSHECRKEVVSSFARVGRHMVVIDGLPRRTKGKHLRSLFGRFGEITEVRVDENNHTAVMTFSTAIAAQMAVAADPPFLRGEMLCVHFPGFHECRNKVALNVDGLVYQVVFIGLPPRLRKNYLFNLFKQFGACTHVRVDLLNCTVVVTFCTANATQMAVAAPPRCFTSAQLRVYSFESHEFSLYEAQSGFYCYFCTLRHVLVGVNHLLSNCRYGMASSFTKQGHKLVVEGLPPRTEEKLLRNLFGQYGDVMKVSVDEKLRTAVVTFSTAIAAQMAVAAKPPYFRGAILRVHLP